MSDKEINVAIAKACGLPIQDVPFTPALASRESYYTPAAFNEYRKAYPSGMAPMKVPDYCNDLNAMREAEMTLTDADHKIYRQHLWLSTDDGDLDFTDRNARDYLTSTARQRAEAFLKTKGLWKQ